MAHHQRNKGIRDRRDGSTAISRKNLAGYEQSREEKEENLSAFFYLGEIEKKNAGDPYFSDFARYYENISPEQKLKLSEAYTETRKAQTSLLKPNIKQALG